MIPIAKYVDVENIEVTLVINDDERYTMTVSDTEVDRIIAEEQYANGASAKSAYRTFVDLLQS